MDPREIGWGDVDGINLANDWDQLMALVNTFGFHTILRNF